MEVLCVHNCEGDFWDITPGNKYTVIEHLPDYLMYISNGKRITEERFKIKNDDGDMYSYPIGCFKVL